MKKINYLIVLFLLVFIVACNNESEKSEASEEEQIINEETSTEENQEDIAEDEEVTANEDVTNGTEQKSEDIKQEETREKQVETLYELGSEWQLVPIEEDTNENVVLLTIDDAPDKYALEMAKTLKDLNAPAIFFVNGHFLESEENKDILRQIHEMGFAIGNHTYNHQRLSEVNEEQQKEDILELSNLIQDIIGEKPKFFRAPNGVNTDYATQLVKDEGMLLMNWTYGYDYFKPYMDAEKLKEAMISGEGPEVDVPYSLLKPGANLLMHDREWTAEALGDIVNGLRKKGYEMADPISIKLPE
ncbi:polysaccharide deacetylase [Gracilibacillus boraciitolerans JCM 21714]|uniref:Polysaccharide deacetylase n=1 Tax=Gracilibacillus boraciitolerans JCM 21714 TaxID=1298598 RepID=W4VG57_9BACI|nr:polysaccharide deacetylase family protein [Gracilibacillus boraciitolerans]GAE91798.1 polysaccharide deacetylase [Gracilibacillus boraciitolerans JCM 21714]